MGRAGLMKRHGIGLLDHGNPNGIDGVGDGVVGVEEPLGKGSRFESRPQSSGGTSGSSSVLKLLKISQFSLKL